MLRHRCTLDIAKFLNERVVESDPLLEKHTKGDGHLSLSGEQEDPENRRRLRWRLHAAW